MDRDTSSLLISQLCQTSRSKSLLFSVSLIFFPRFRKKFDRCHFNLSFRLQTVNFTKSFSSGFIRLKNEADFEKKKRKKQIVTFCEDQFFSTSTFLFVGKLKFISWKHYSMGCSDVVIYNFFFPTTFSLREKIFRYNLRKQRRD